ncbi:trigger factor [Clostridium sp. CAG:567]|jgi:trigger factor|nr:trigger factor [Clostridium sp. CAG:567]
MSVKVENTENKNEVKLSFVVEAEKFDEAMKKVYAKTAKYFTIPGFRKGKAPMNMVEKQYGTEIFHEDTFNELVPEIYETAIKENNIQVVSNPDIDITQIGKGKDLIFTAIVQIKPEVKLGKYKGIELKKIEYNVSDHDIEHELGHMAEHNARLVSIEDRPVEKGDITVIDFEGSIDGVPFEGGKAEKHELEIGSNTFIPGFEDQIVGMKLEEEKDITVTFPEDYFSKELAGKPAVFKVKLHEIKKKELPKIDDEFAKDVSEFETLAELKNSIKERMQKANEEKAKYEMEDAALKAVSDNVEIDIPSGMIDAEIDNMMKDIEQRLQYQGLTLAQYFTLSGKTEAQVREEMKEQAKKAVKSRLVIEAIIKAEDIKPEEKEVEEKLKEMAKNYGKTEEEMSKNEYIKEYIENNMKVEKAIEFIVNNAKIK